MPSHESKVAAPTQTRLKQELLFFLPQKTQLHRVTDVTTWMRSKHGLPCVSKVVRSSQGNENKLYEVIYRCVYIPCPHIVTIQWPTNFINEHPSPLGARRNSSWPFCHNSRMLTYPLLHDPH